MMTNKNPVGRPTVFDERFIEQARIIGANLGSTNVQLAAIFGICEKTLYDWIAKYPAFLQAIKDGREQYDTNLVQASLRDRATGYSHPDVHITNYKGLITKTPITKHYPPDATSMIFWLKNRDPNRWKDKQEVAHSGVMGVVNMTTDEYKEARKEMLIIDDC